MLAFRRRARSARVAEGPIMQPRVHSNTTAELDVFVEANFGRLLDADAGPWLGQAALLAELHEAIGPVPASWQDAVNAALDPYS
jgi:hypothetical protein